MVDTPVTSDKLQPACQRRRRLGTLDTADILAAICRAPQRSTLTRARRGSRGTSVARSPRRADGQTPWTWRGEPRERLTVTFYSLVLCCG